MKYLLLCLALVAFGGCSGRHVYKTEDLPTFVCNPFTDNNIGAAGIAPAEKDISAQLKKADEDARVQLAHSLLTEVHSKVSESFKATVTNIDKTCEEARETYESFSEQVSDMLIGMSHRKEVVIHPDTGDAFTWVVIDDDHKEEAMEIVNEVAEQAIQEWQESKEKKMLEEESNELIVLAEDIVEETVDDAKESVDIMKAQIVPDVDYRVWASVIGALLLILYVRLK